MVKKLFTSTILLGVFLISSKMCAMEDVQEPKTVPISHHQKGVTLLGNAYPYFKSWGPTLVLVAGVSAYTAIYDRKAPLKALSWVKSNFLCKPKLSSKSLVTIPAAVLGVCAFSEYYKLRVQNTSFYRNYLARYF